MDTEFKGVRAFTMIPIGIQRDPELLDKAPKAILLMGEIISMLNITGEFFMSNKEIARRLRVTKPTVNNYLSLLEDKKLIQRIKVIDKNTNEIKGRKIIAGDALVKYTSIGWSNELNYPSKTGNTGVVKPVLHKKNNIKEQLIEQKNIHSASGDALRVSELEKSFEKLWQKYPNKKGKKQAFNHYKAWRKKSVKNTDEYLEKKLNQYIAYIKANKIKDRYIQYGSTWFNGGFDDEYKVDNPNSSKPVYDFTSEEWQAKETDNLDDLPF